MNKFFVRIIKIYQIVISPLLGPNCRFMPTCSCYSVACFQEFSFFKALWYSIFRTLKCHPFNKGGFDPIPK